MDIVNVLIVASSDMFPPEDDYNQPETVIDIDFPCSLYKGKKSNVNIYNIPNRDFPRCSKCNYTEIEHKYRYPMWPLNNIKGLKGLPLQYSDLWHNKQELFEIVKKIKGENIQINYHTCNPYYFNRMNYLPTIEKINNIVSDNLQIKGGIHYLEPYNFSCDLEYLQKRNEYKGTKYEFIFVVGGGLCSLYTPKNFTEMTLLLTKGKNKLGIIVNFEKVPTNLITGEFPKYSNQFRAINPINFILSYGGNTLYDKKTINKYITKKTINQCITNYSKILTDRKFIEINEILFRQRKY